jgi:hypothetical protein
MLANMQAKAALAKVPSKNDIDCPGCAKDGHSHNLVKTDKGTLKCTGTHCGEEYVMLPKKVTTSDQGFIGYCKNCGTPVNKSMDSCPSCGKTSAVRYK